MNEAQVGQTEQSPEFLKKQIAALRQKLQAQNQTIQVQQAALNKVANQRNAAMNQVAQLQVELDAAENQIKILSQLQTGKVEMIKKDPPPGEAQKSTTSEATNLEVAQQIAATPVGA